MRNAQPEDVHPIQNATHGIGVNDPSFRRALEPAFKFLWSVTAGDLGSFGGGPGPVRRGAGGCGGGARVPRALSGISRR